jgi:transcriptional regulator with XRE-family HTH domain
MTNARSVARSSQAGDLAHRLVAARGALHLTVEQVAERASIHPNYLRYLESSTGLASETSLRALAAALETSQAALLGAVEPARSTP